MKDATLIAVRVQPRASKDEIVGWQEGVLRVRLRAPPVKGRANEALAKLLAARLGVAPSDIEVVGGATQRSKRVRVAGRDAGEVARDLS